MSRKRTAQIISYLLSPINNAFYAIIIIALFLLQRKNFDDFTISLLLAFFFLCIMPVIGILIYTKKGVVDIWVSNQKIRTPFYLIAIIGYLIALIVFSLVDNFHFTILFQQELPFNDEFISLLQSFNNFNFNPLLFT